VTGVHRAMDRHMLANRVAIADSHATNFFRGAHMLGELI
jgi:hypothetical protein